MRISVILAHPDKGSFNHAIAAVAVQVLSDAGHMVSFHDLYAEQFDPVLPAREILPGSVLSPRLKTHCDEIAEADGIVIVHPNWWGQPPAIMKGWVDRVFRAGVAYSFVEGDNGEGVPIGLLKAHTMVVFNTSNTPAEREHAVFGDPLETIWKKCIFGLCGIGNFHRHLFSVVVTSTEMQRKTWLRQVEEAIIRHFHVDSIVV